MQWIGEYGVVRLIGEGGMGKVYEAEERLSRRRVALKVLRDDLAQSEDGRRMFLREMSILAHLDHPNVVRCLACTEAGGHLVMVLEHLDGQTLRERLRQKVRLPWQEAVRIAAQIAAGLSAAHTHQPPIVHRDLKPENVMVLGNGHAKVMDFGIAKVLDAMGSQTVYTVGTLQYMSPEQIEGQTAEPRSDLYCLGLILYEMLTGQPPFASESPRELLNLHCTQAPPRFSHDVSHGLPPDLEQLVFALLAKDPNQRPPNAEALQRQLERIESGLQPAAVPMSVGPSAPSHPSSMGTIMLIERAGASQQRGRTVAVVLAIVAVVLVLGATGTYLALFHDRDARAADVDDTSKETEPTAREDAPTRPNVLTEAERKAKQEEIRRQAEEERRAAQKETTASGADEDDGGASANDGANATTGEGGDDDEGDDGGGLLNRFGFSGSDDEKDDDADPFESLRQSPERPEPPAPPP